MTATGPAMPVGDLQALQSVLTDEAERGADTWDQRARDLVAQGRVGPAILAEARAVGLGGTASRLAKLVAQHARALDEAAADERTRDLAAVVREMRRSAAALDEVATTLLAGILDGADAAYALHSLARALDRHGRGRAALDVIRAVMALGSSTEMPPSWR